MAGATDATIDKKREEESIQRGSPHLSARAIKELAESRKHPAEAVDTEIRASIKVSSKKEEIDLINVQIEGLKKRMASAVDNTRQESYSQGIAALEDKLEAILFDTN